MFAASRCFYTEGCCSTAAILVVADKRGAEDRHESAKKERGRGG